MQTIGLPLMLALSVPIHISGPQPGAPVSNGFTLAGARNHLRPLLVFTPRGSDPQVLQQFDLLHKPDLLDRNIIVVPIAVFGAPPPPEKLDASVFAIMKDTDAASARQRFHVAPSEFTVILLGKDGGEKLRSHVPVTMNQLNQLIDAMPMRQHEIKSRN